MFAVWLHIAALVAWLGGMFFLTLVVVPVMRAGKYESVSAQLVDEMGVRYRALGWVCLGLLVVTGFTNLLYRGYGLESIVSLEIFRGRFGYILEIKLFLVAIIILLSFLHDFFVGPRAAQALKRGLEEGEKLRAVSSWIGRVNLLLALVVVFLGVMLVRGG